MFVAVLSRWWRIYPRETLARDFSPTRRELLTHFAPKTKTAIEMLEGDDPKRAVKCYLDALDILKGLKSIAAQGDGAPGMTPTQKLWFEGRSNLYPSSIWLPAIRESIVTVSTWVLNYARHLDDVLKDENKRDLAKLGL